MLRFRPREASARPTPANRPDRDSALCCTHIRTVRPEKLISTIANDYYYRLMYESLSLSVPTARSIINLSPKSLLFLFFIAHGPFPRIRSREYVVVAPRFGKDHLSIARTPTAVVVVVMVVVVVVAESTSICLLLNLSVYYIQVYMYNGA
jgi:hypothetical protein